MPGTTEKHTTDADDQYLYATPKEVAMRLEHGIPATESHFTQIRPMTRGARGFSAAQADGTVVKNGRMGRDLRHSRNP